jgi:hypothetical protein
MCFRRCTEKNKVNNTCVYARQQTADTRLRTSSYALRQPSLSAPTLPNSTRLVSFRFTTWPTGKCILQRVFFLFAPCLTQV